MLYKYASAVVFVAVATLVTALLRKAFPNTPNALFFCVVLSSAWLGGWGPGLLAGILSSVSIIFLLPPPTFAGLTAVGEILRFLIFLAATLFVAWVQARERRIQCALREARDELEQRVQERTKELASVNDGLKTEIAERQRTAALLEGQKRVLEMIAGNAPLSDSLAALMRLMEAHAPGMLGSILLLDDDGLHLRHGAAPSLPAEYMAAIDGQAIGPAAGSCGTAAFCKEPVMVEDIATDARWENYRAAALPHGLRACWSTPVFDAQRRVVGTFAMYYRHPALPNPEHRRLIEMATHIAAIAICRHRIQAALRESEAKLKEAQRLARIGYWERDLIADTITWSEETYRIWGRPPGEIITQAKLQEMIHPDDRALQSQALAEITKGGRPYDLEYRLIRPDGQIRFVHVWDEIQYDGSGRPVRMFGTVQDITERKRAAESLEESQQLLRLVLATLPVGVVVTNRAGDILHANEASKRIWGDTIIVSGRERWARSKGFWHESGERISPGNWASVRALSQGQISLNELIDIETFGGQRKTIKNSAAPIRNAQGLIVGVVVINEDVTVMVRSEEKLRQTQSELTRRTRLTMMGELTASIAHEVNQPLAAVVTNANAASRWLAVLPPNLEEARKAVDRIAREGSRASEVIKRIRALFKKGELEKTPFNINELIQETVALTEAELIRQKVLWQTRLAQDLPPVPADRVQLQQVLLNLIVNAIDSLSAVAEMPRVLRIHTERSGPDLVQVTVQDTGVGIKPDEPERLFQPFYTTKPQGLGMGLSLSRSIVEAHGGQLWATANQGCGATFHLTLPLKNGGKG